MKRARSQTTMCLQCFQSLGVGFAMNHHKKLCRGLSAGVNSSGLLQQVGNPMETQEPDQMETQEPDQQPEQEQNDQKEHIVADQDNQLARGVVETAVRRINRILSPKMKEILSFLRTAEMGEGCSREHAQGWLNREHQKGGPSARLLPKDIRTLWKQVAKVMDAKRGLLFTCHAYLNVYLLCYWIGQLIFLLMCVFNFGLICF